MPCRLDQQSAGVAVAGLRDRPARVLLAGPMVGRHQPQARPRSSLRHNVVQSPISTHYANAASVPPRADNRACRRPARTAGRRQASNLLVEAVAPEPDGEHRLVAVIKRRACALELEHLPAKPRLMRSRPRPAVEHPPVAQQPASTIGGGRASDRHTRAPAHAPNPVLPHHARRAPHHDATPSPTAQRRSHHACGPARHRPRDQSRWRDYAPHRTRPSRRPVRTSHQRPF